MWQKQARSLKKLKIKFNTETDLCITYTITTLMPPKIHVNAIEQVFWTFLGICGIGDTKLMQMIKILGKNGRRNTASHEMGKADLTTGYGISTNLGQNRPSGLSNVNII